VEVRAVGVRAVEVNDYVTLEGRGVLLDDWRKWFRI
jgi:hypothetical protein